MIGKPVIILKVEDGPLGPNYAAIEAADAAWTFGDLLFWLNGAVKDAVGAAEMNLRRISFVDVFSAVTKAARSTPTVILHPIIFGQVNAWYSYEIRALNASLMRPVQVTRTETQKTKDADGPKE